MSLHQRIATLEASGVPTWIFDPQRSRICWANSRAVELWGAPDLAELLARDLSDPTPAGRARIEGQLEKIREGGSMEEEWTFYPQGKAVRVDLAISAIELDDGSVGMLEQAFRKPEGPDPALVRSIEALRYT